MTLRRALAMLCLAGAASTSHAAGAYAFPSYTGAAQMLAQCRAYVTDMRAEEKRLQALSDADLGGLLPALDAMTRRYEDVVGPMTVLAAVHPDKAIRAAAQTCEAEHQAFLGEFHQNSALFQKLQQVLPADEIDRQFMRDQIEAFEDAGVGLAPAERLRMQAIAKRLTPLSQQFDQRIRDDDTVLAFSEAQLAGVPPPVWALAPQDGQGRFPIVLSAASYDAVVRNAKDATTRERMWRAANRVGGQANLKVLAEMTTLRREQAKLFGFDSYADLVLRRRMARSAARATAMLDRVAAVVTPREEADLAMLRELQRKDAPASTKVQRWDTDYYTQRILRERYQLDPEQFRKYLPPDASLAFVFRIAEQLFGLRFVAAPQTLWHEDARRFEVQDAASGTTVGTLFVDLYPRPDKFTHAAVWNFRNAAVPQERVPAAALVANLGKRGLTLTELETLLHEFGHALHVILSTTRYASQGGTNTRLDFSEAPSQMLQDWIYEPSVMALYKQACAKCEPLPPDLLARAAEARHLAKGIVFGRQLLLARYDLVLNGPQSLDPLATWKRLEGATPLGAPDGDWMPAGFSHIASDYAAGYYAYLWSLVLAEDLRSAFVNGEGQPDRLNPAVGRRYRETLLSQGGQAEPSELIQRFLGRETNADAFFAALKR